MQWSASNVCKLGKSKSASTEQAMYKRPIFDNRMRLEIACGQVKRHDLREVTSSLLRLARFAKLLGRHRGKSTVSGSSMRMRLTRLVKEQIGCSCCCNCRPEGRGTSRVRAVRQPDSWCQSKLLSSSRAALQVPLMLSDRGVEQPVSWPATRGKNALSSQAACVQSHVPVSCSQQHSSSKRRQREARLPEWLLSPSHLAVGKSLLQIARILCLIFSDRYRLLSVRSE